jgi:hypothetical protein
MDPLNPIQKLLMLPGRKQVIGRTYHRAGSKLGPERPLRRIKGFGQEFRTNSTGVSGGQYQAKVGIHTAS